MGPGDLSSDTRAHRVNEVWLEFGDGEYLFKLKLKQIAELQEKSGAGIGTIYARVELGDYYVEDLNESIRLGLVGGAKGEVDEQELVVSPEQALKLFKRYGEDRPLSEKLILAKAILRACIHGYAPRDKPKGKAEASTTETPEPTGSTSPRPTQTE